MTNPITIVFPIFPGVTQLDFTGPYQVLVRTPRTRIVVASLGGAAVEANGLTFANLAVLEEVAEATVLCVPGGSVEGMLRDPAFLASSAGWVRGRAMSRPCAPVRCCWVPRD